MKTYVGSCHCGKVRFEADAEIENLLSCNCSYCSRKGMLLAFVPAAQFRLLSGEEELSEYRFNKHVIQHLFCRICGVQPFGRGKDQKGNDTVALNARCFEDVDINQFSLFPYDGKSI